MYELIYLAFLSDSTRVATFQLGRENGEGPHDLLSRAVGLGGAHGLTHDVKKPNGWKNLGTYNRYQAEEFGRFVQKLKDTPEPPAKETCWTTLSRCMVRLPAASTCHAITRSFPPAERTSGFTNGRYLKFGKGNEDNQAAQESIRMLDGRRNSKWKKFHLPGSSSLSCNALASRPIRSPEFPER